jgi:hypothetical protein
MDRQIIVAATIAFALATAVKILTPLETAAKVDGNTLVGTSGALQTSQDLPLTFTQPDPMWLVGP